MTRTAGRGALTITRRVRLIETEMSAVRGGQGIHVKYVPRHLSSARQQNNDYLIDRRAQKTKRSYSGVEGIAMQDASLQESMGTDCRSHQGTPGFDRHGNHPGARQRLLSALRAFTEKGVTPPGVDAGASTRAIGIAHPASGRGV